MPVDQKISDLSDGGLLAAADLLVIARGAANNKITFEDSGLMTGPATATPFAVLYVDVTGKILAESNLVTDGSGNWTIDAASFVFTNAAARLKFESASGLSEIFVTVGQLDLVGDGAIGFSSGVGREVLLQSDGLKAISDHNLGSAALPWGDFFMSGNADIGGDVEFDGDLKRGVNGVNALWEESVAPANGLYPASVDPVTESLRVFLASQKEARVVTHPPSVLSRSAMTFIMADDYDGRAIEVHIDWAPSTTNVGTIFWQLKEGIAVAGDDLTSAADIATVSNNTDSSPGVVDEATTTVISFTPAGGAAVAGQRMYMVLLRFGTHGTDLFTGDANVIGLRIKY